MEELEKVVPIVVHGDETPITGRGKIWNSSAVFCFAQQVRAGVWGLISEMRVEVSANGKTTAQGDCLGLLD